ncbi:UPF0158 family protein [Longimicrobium sp.]|uniref:UPF0158 family protein n=1 Tax=Longimicrobium sp. TaxID=2029185 RepID=UPI002E346565|nr:UPF0158 family protein [Longimicrobium sp.]HEX6037167.1 UPF0158 family protein [Longimicrobium sp.]
MPKLQIDTGDIALAMSDNETQWVLDLQTGEVLMAEWARVEARGGPDAGEAWDPEAFDEYADDDLDPERFRHIESVGSNEGFRWMERFADDQPDDRVRGKLLRALEQRRPFRSFKDALTEFPEVREAWFTYELGQQVREARAWLEAKGIDAELVNKHRAADAGVKAG